MNEPSTQYQIRIKEYLESKWTGWFDGLTITHEAIDGKGIILALEQEIVAGLASSTRQRTTWTEVDTRLCQVGLNDD